LLNSLRRRGSAAILVMQCCSAVVLHLGSSTAAPILIRYKFYLLLIFRIAYLPPLGDIKVLSFMSLLIPGLTSLGKDFDVFLEPIIEELKEQWKGVDTFHVLHRDNKKGFTLRAVVLWCIHDFLALSTLSGRTTKGYFACMYCNKNPLSRSLRKKLVYLGHHRYLRRDHPWRKSLDFGGKTEDRDAQQKFTLQEVLEELKKVKDVCRG